MSSSSIASSSDSLRARRYAACVLIGVVVLLALTEALLRGLIVPVLDGAPHRVDLVYRADGGDVVVGDSHMFRGFVTQSALVNLAGGGSSARALEIVAREYFRHREPGRVVIAASPQLFNPARETAGAQGYEKYFGQNFGLPFQIYVFERGVSHRLSWLLDPAGLLRRADQARRRKRPGNRIDAGLARKMAKMDTARRREFAKGIVAKNRPVANLQDAAGFAAYRRMVADLVDRGARVCLVRTAVTANVEDLTADDPRFIDAHRLLREVADEFSVPYVDYRELGVSFGDDLFIDPDHLTATGGDLFSRSVVNACFGNGAFPRAHRDSKPRAPA